jgi:phospholipid/cholesterol/gamma-HCH transport system substrate-binding protein
MRTDVRAHWARIRVLFTCLVALSILTTLVYLLSGGGLFKAKATLRTYFEDSGGMEPGAIVEFNGVKIGKVSSIRLSSSPDPRKTVEVRMSVDRRFLPRIPSDSKGEIQTENPIGDKLIQINRGKSPIPVQDGSELAHVPATNVYVRIDLSMFNAQLRSVDDVLADIQAGKGSLGEFVMTDQLYLDLLSGVSKLKSDIDTAVSTTSTAGKLVYSPQMFQDISVRLQRLDDSLAELQSGRSPAGRFFRDPAQYDDIRTRVADLRASVRQAQDSRFLKSDDLYRDWNRQLAALIRNVDDFNAGQGNGAVLAGSQAYEALGGALGGVVSTLREFRTNPHKFLRLKVF